MSTLVTFPRLTLQAALAAHLRALGQLDTETLRYPNAPSVTTVEPLREAVRAAEEEREALLSACTRAAEWFREYEAGHTDPFKAKRNAARAENLEYAIARARGAAEAQHEPAMIFVGDGAARCPRCGTEYVGTTTGYVIDRCICGERIAAEAQAP